MKSGFKKLYRLIFRKAARHEQQTMPGKGYSSNLTIFKSLSIIAFVQHPYRWEISGYQMLDLPGWNI